MGPPRAFPLVRPLDVLVEVVVLPCVVADEDEATGEAAVAVTTEEEEGDALEAGEGRRERE